jgi:uncharacterized protein (TIGR03435 family)
VLVDQKGNIADITYPLSLTEQRINDLLAGRKLLAAEKRREGYRAGEFPQSMSQGKLPLFQILIRPSESTNHQSTGGGGALTALDFTLEELLTTIYPFTASRIITNSPLPLERFDVVASVPDRNDETRNNMLEQAFGAAFGIHAVVETREVPVYLLTQKSGSARGLVPAATDSFAAALGPGKISGVGLPMALLCQGLEKGLGKPVVDETGLKGKFDIELKWEQKEPDHLNPQALIDAVRERLGLDLSPAQRPVEVLVIDKTPPKEK